MTKEFMILKAFLLKRDIFEKYAPYVLGLKNMDRNMKITLGFIKTFYEQYNSATTIPESDFRLFLKTADKFKFMSQNESYVTDIYKTQLSNNDLTLDVIESCVEQHIMSRVLDKAALVLDNNQSKILSTVQDEIDEFHSIIRNPPQGMVEYTLNLQELVNDEITTLGVPFCNTKPNDVIRGMKVGQLGLMYAYVDVGKTSYGVANLCSAADHLFKIKSDRPIIYGGNEEAIKRVSLRTIQCMTGWNNREIERNMKLVRPIIYKKGYGLIKFIDHIRTLSIVEKLLDKHNPRIMFVDRGTNVSIGGSKKEGVNALEEIFETYRDLAKRYDCTIICMIQGGDDCFDKQYPTLRDIYGSKSAIQGTLDWAISIGVRADDVKYINWRYFNITKNKGDKSRYECRFDRDRCQFKQVV